MKYSKVYINTISYELPPHVISSDDIEERLEPLYKNLHFKKGQLEALTGIRERRFWNPIHTMHEAAIKAGNKALMSSGIDSNEIGILIYAGVCRDHLEPATACAVADGLNISSNAQIYDLSNACLGVVNGIIQVANAIELGQIKAGLIVSCESARQIVNLTIERLLKYNDMETFKKTVATLTGGAGAVAVLLTAESLSNNTNPCHKLLGGVIKNAPQHHKLCQWGPDTGIPASGLNIMETDSVGVLKNGVILAIETFKKFKQELELNENQPDKIICHQVGGPHQKALLEALNIPKEKDFTTFQYLGNIGTVSLPITAAIASERDFLKQNDIVGFLGIGSGLNCIMLGVEW